ncbi:MAG: SusC/RagA family TonB-linked outer membrane protein, partial [Bacteroidales bacterium]
LMGGSDDTKYALSFTRYDENGIFKNSDFDKTTAKFRITQKVLKNVTMDATINYANTNRNGVGTSADNGRFNMLAQIISARPTGGLKIDDETLLNSAIDPEMLEDGTSLAQVNPVIQTESVTNKKRTEMWSGNMSFTWQIIKGLTFKTAGTYNTTNNRTDIFFREGSKEAYRNGQKPYGQSQMGRDKRWTNYNNLTWKQRIKKHNYDVMLGQEIAYRSSEYLLGQAMDFPFDNLGNNNLGIGATPSKVQSSFLDKTLLSFFARGNYNYDNRYLLTATFRADGSSVFSDKNKWGFFPSFSAAWRVSEEAFMKDIEWMTNLKVRAGYGTVGNDNIMNFLSLDLYEQSKYGVGGSMMTVLTPKQIKNQNLKWEGSTTYNLGFDLGFVDNRINVVADFFIKNTQDLLLSQALPEVTGFSSQMQNIGKIQNRGIELGLNTVNIQTKNFSWSTNFNISFIRNELKALESGANYRTTCSSFDSNMTQDDYIAIVGQSLGLMYGYEFDGIYQSSDFFTTPDGKQTLKPGVTNNTRYTEGVRPGVVKYKDQNGDGIITTADRTVIGNAMPKWFGGITNTFNYKGIDLSVMLQFNYGNDIYNATRLYSTQTRSGRRNMLAEVADRWTPTNASNKVPAYDGYITNDVYSRFIEDGSFLRLKNITLGYTIPAKLTKKAFISKLRVYATGQNLFCLTGYTGFDPEVSRYQDPMRQGLDWGAYPKSRVFTFGLDLQF